MSQEMRSQFGEGLAGEFRGPVPTWGVFSAIKFFSSICQGFLYDRYFLFLKCLWLSKSTSLPQIRVLSSLVDERSTRSYIQSSHTMYFYRMRGMN